MAGERLVYRQDADNLLFPGDIGPAIPEPASAGLGMLALVGAGIGALRRRR